VIVPAPAEVLARVEPVGVIVWEAATSRAAVAEIVLPSTVAPEVIAAQVRDRAAAEAVPAWDPVEAVVGASVAVAVAVAAVAVAVAGGGGNDESQR